MLDVQSVHLSFERKILDGVTLNLQPGEVLGIVGKSGAGKTSLLKIMAGLLDPTEGEVYFEGKRVIGPNQKLVPGHDDVQLVNQDFALDLYHSVEDNLKQKILYLPKKERDAFVNELLEIVELEHTRNQQAITLSGGEQQRLSIARALASEPKLLLLDEPFVHLDQRIQLKISNYLMEMKRVRKMSIVLVSHDGGEVLSFSDKILYVKNGKIRRKTTPVKAYYNYKTIEEGELYGWVNSVKIDGKTIYFRPDEYEVAPLNKAQINIDFVDTTFIGGAYRNTFVRQDGKPVVLVSNEALNNVEGIRIKRKN